MFNVMYADRDGNIFYAYNGAVRDAQQSSIGPSLSTEATPRLNGRVITASTSCRS
jgi:hypothetical protein